MEERKTGEDIVLLLSLFSFSFLLAYKFFVLLSKRFDRQGQEHSKPLTKKSDFTYFMCINKVHAFQPGVEEGLSTHRAITGVL